MLSILLILVGICGVVIFLLWLFFPVGRQRIIEREFVMEDRVKEFEVFELPVAESLEFTLLVHLSFPDAKIELWDPNGNLVTTKLSSDRRGPLDRMSDLVSGNSLIYSTNLNVWNPMEGIWNIKVFNPIPNRFMAVNFYVDTITPTVLKVELAEPRMLGDDQQVPIIARLYRGNELVCDENLQIDVEIKVQPPDPPKTRSLQSDGNCVFTGSTGAIESFDLGFYVVANYGFVRRQLFFDKPD